MSYADCKTKIKALLEGMDGKNFKEALNAFNFDYVPKTVSHKSYIIYMQDMLPASALKDMNRFFAYQQTVCILIAYEMNTRDARPANDQFGPDAEDIARLLEDRANFSENSMLVAFKSASVSQPSQRRPNFAVMQVLFEVKFRKI